MCVGCVFMVSGTEAKIPWASYLLSVLNGILKSLGKCVCSGQEGTHFNVRFFVEAPNSVLALNCVQTNL